MTMKFEELDETTRRHMLDEFDKEELRGNPYRAKGLSAVGSLEFSGLMRQAIRSGNEETLTDSLLHLSYWNPMETYTRNGITRERRVNLQQAAERLSLTEFNTWYVRGLAKKLMAEDITHCQVYRASEPKWEPSECSKYGGTTCQDSLRPKIRWNSTVRETSFTYQHTTMLGFDTPVIDAIVRDCKR